MLRNSFKKNSWEAVEKCSILGGVMENLDSKWIDNRESKCVAEVHKSPARLSLWNMRDVFILVTGGVAAGALFSTIEVTYGRRKARRGRERALAARYGEKWRNLASGGLRTNRYNLSRPVIRRGLGGLEPCSLADVRQREQNRSKQKPVNEALIRPPPFVPDLNFGRHSVVLFCSRCRRDLDDESVSKTSGTLETERKYNFEFEGVHAFASV
ncbi:hypothetical protein COOONC_01832 [Cooperia oncophora]